MTGPEIITKVEALSLPEGSYVVFGSGPMAVAGIREAQDIDMLISPELFEQLRAAGWQELHKENEGDDPLTRDDFEVHQAWNFSPYQPTLEQLLSSATYVGNVAVASLAEVRKWKKASGRPKDLVDIKLIDDYLQSK